MKAKWCKLQRSISHGQATEACGFDSLDFGLQSDDVRQWQIFDRNFVAFNEDLELEANSFWLQYSFPYSILTIPRKFQGELNDLMQLQITPTVDINLNYFASDYP